MSTYLLRSMTLEDFKRVRYAEIPFERTLTVIGGRNMQGKSSCLDAFMTACLGMKYAPLMPVRKGQDAARIEVVVDTPSGPLKITRKITSDGKTSVALQYGDLPAIKSGVQSELDRLFSATAADPLRFTRMEPRKRVEFLREILGLDFTDLDDRRKDLEAERRLAEQTMKGLEAKFERLPAAPEGTPDDEVSIAELTRRMQDANDHNRSVDAAEAEAEAKAARLKTADEKISAQEEAVADLRRRLEEAEERLAAMNEKRGEIEAEALAAQKVAAAMARIDVAPIRSELEGAEALNRNVRAKKDREAGREEWQESRRAYVAADDAVKAIDEEKRRALAEAKYPVPGMTLEDADVFLNGLPFDQASSAEQLRAAVPLVLAGAGKVPFIIVRDGSLLDEGSLQAVAEAAEAAGAQVIVERVSTGEECTVIMEDGAVPGQPGPERQMSLEGVTA